MANCHKFQIWISLCLGITFFNLAWAACPGDWLNIVTGSNPGQACYKLVPGQRRTFDSANQYCQGQGGYLARDTTLTVHFSLKPYIISASKSATNPTTFWLGLTDNNVTGGPWMWVGGSSIGSFQYFASVNNSRTQNKRDCVFVSTTDRNLRWMVTSDCNQYKAFICQRDINGSSVVVTTVLPRLNCPFLWTGFPAQQICFRLYSSPKSWTDARVFCQQAGGDLVKIVNADFNNFVNGRVNFQKGVYWIGLNDRANEGNFVWLDDTVKANFTNWNSNMPNNAGGNENCVALDGHKNFKWDDGDCAVSNRFICQRNPLGGIVTTQAVSTLSHANCGTGWEDVPNSDICFQFNTKLLSWLDAQADCRTSGGDLASVRNVQEQFYLVGRTLAFTSSFFWIGANDRSTESGWKWTDGTPFAFLNWDNKQPDNSHNSDCAALVQQSGKWDDLPCEDRYGYICKKKGRTTLPSLVTTTTFPTRLPGDVMFGCPTGWKGFRGSCYKAVLSSTGVNWATASQSCSGTTMQGALAAIIDAYENRYIFSLIPSNYTGDAWIGLEDPVENTFTWVDGTPVSYTNWNVGEPNNANNEDCVVMSSTNGKWNDAQCTSQFKLFFCKRSKSILPRTDSNQNPGCLANTYAYGSHCYNFISTGKIYADAQADCKTRSSQGNLATIDSGHLQAFLSAQLSTLPGPTYWIGLTQNGTGYNWQSGYPVTFTYWGSNHTGNEVSTCVAMSQANPSGLWINYPCNNVMPYVCESPRVGYTTQSTAAAVTNQTCPAGWPGYGSHCYRAFSSSPSDRLSWTDAKKFCASQANGGNLISVYGSATQAWLVNNVIKPAGLSGNYWIGLNDRDSESRYVWADNSPFVFSNWAPNEPNDAMHREDCVFWGFPSNNWNDEYCYVSNNWICQVPKGSVIAPTTPTPTGVVSPQCGDSTWQLYNNFCYAVSPSPGPSALTSWFSARQKCLDLGADLASITAEDENGFITSLITKGYYYSYWIGLNALDKNTFSWTDLTPIGFVAWGVNEPNDNNGDEKCVELTGVGSWNDKQCQSLNGYVCKKRPANYSPNTTAPVVYTGGCPGGFVSIPSLSYCYYLGGTTNTTLKNFTDANAACQMMANQSVLASIHSTMEEKFILILASSSRYRAWIGLNDRVKRNSFVWVDNLVVTYTKWGPGQPDENLNSHSADARKDCVDMEISRNPGTWNDRQCSMALSYICETKKDPALPTSAPNTTGCNSGYLRFRNSCYGYHDDPLNWTSAESMCKSEGGNLASISNGIEQAYLELVTQHTDNVQFWIGLQYVLATASFNWADGWPVRYSNWGKDEPKLGGGQSCVSHTVDGQWQVVPCAMELPFVCEVQFGSPPPTRAVVAGRCPDSTWFNNAGYCYHIETSSPVTWAQANAACKDMGSNLTSIHSVKESRYLTNAIGAARVNVWIGLYKGQGTGFSWYDGSAVQYTYWGTGEPSDPDSFLHQDCVKIVSQYGTWADTDCLDKNAYICKMPQRARPSRNPNSTYSTKGFSTGTGFRTSPTFSGSPVRSSWSPYTTTSQTPYTRPYRRTTPRTYTRHFTAAAENGGKSSGLSGGGVAGVVIGTLILVALVAVAGFFGFRYYRGQSIPLLGGGAQRLDSSPPSGFENATYSSSRDNKVNLEMHGSQDC